MYRRRYIRRTGRRYGYRKRSFSRRRRVSRMMSRRRPKLEMKWIDAAQDAWQTLDTGTHIVQLITPAQYPAGTGRQGRTGARIKTMNVTFEIKVQIDPDANAPYFAYFRLILASPRIGLQNWSAYWANSFQPNINSVPNTHAMVYHDKVYPLVNGVNNTGGEGMLASGTKGNYVLKKYIKHIRNVQFQANSDDVIDNQDHLYMILCNCSTEGGALGCDIEYQWRAKTSYIDP